MPPFIVALYIIAPDWVTIQMSFSWQMYKQTVVRPHSGMPLSNKKKAATDMSGTRDQCQMYYAEWKKADSKTSYY